MSCHRALLDTGWLYLLSGLALLAVVVLVPARDELSEMRRQEQQLRAAAEMQQERLRRYGEFIRAVDVEDPVAVRRLVSANLNLGDPSREPVMLRVSRQGGDIFSWIEPEPVRLDQPGPPGTLLRRLLGRAGLRPWLLAGAAMCIFIGLLPPIRDPADSHEDEAMPTAG